MQGSLLLIPYYISWHYTQAIKDLFILWKNFMWFSLHFFSIGLLLKTLFQPFQRLKEKYKGGLDIEDYFATIIVNIMMRIVGFFVRSVTIILGLIIFILTVILGGLFLIVWIFLPAIILFIFITSLRAFLTL